MKWTLPFLIVLFSCGKSFNSDAFKRPDKEPEEAQEFQQNYRADVKAINPSRSSAEGQVLVRLVEDDFEVTITMRRIPKTLHPQRILTGKNCPGKESDANHDGVISFFEAQAVSGPTLIPLDGDLDQNQEEAGSFPSGNFLGVYAYNEAASRSRLEGQLSSKFLLENRVVMVFGVAGDLTIPIACGELTPVTGSE
jgi:hypothetical protein